MNSDVGEFENVKAVFLEKFWKREEPQDVIHAENDAMLDALRFVESLERIDIMYNCAGFNDEEKIGFLRVAIIKILEMATLLCFVAFLHTQILRKLFVTLRIVGVPCIHCTSTRFHYS